MRPPKANPQFHLCDSHRNVLEFVRRNPGCCKFDAAKAGTYSNRRDPSRQYYLVNTLIRQGYLYAELKGNRYELSIPLEVDW